LSFAIDNINLGIPSRKIRTFSVSCTMQHRPSAISATAANLVRCDIDTVSNEIRCLAQTQR